MTRRCPVILAGDQAAALIHFQASQSVDGSSGSVHLAGIGFV